MEIPGDGGSTEKSTGTKTPWGVGVTKLPIEN